MKILIIGDPHFKVKNVIEIDLLYQKIQDILKENTYDYIIILGDILHDHDRLHTTPLNKAYDFIQMCRLHTKTICLVGNHDFINNREFMSTNHWMNGMKQWDNVDIIDKTTSYDLFTCVPYVEPGRFQEALSYVSDWKDKQVIFAHQEIKGCKMGAIVSEEGDEWDEMYPMLISGHIHDNQKVGDNVYYPGSSMQHSYAESGDKVVAVYDTDTKDIQEMDISTVHKKIIYKEISEIKKMKMTDVSVDTKIVLRGDPNEFTTFKKTKKYKDLIKSGIPIVYKYKSEEEAPQIQDDDNFETILHQIVENKNNELLMTDYKNIILNK